jgi:hypothetical protein
MNTSKRHAVLLVSLLMALPGAVAQTTDEDQQNDQPEPVPTAPAAKPAPVKPSEPPPQSSGSPFEYEASEQISEDLSVSFPVDI